MPPREYTPFQRFSGLKRTLLEERREEYEKAVSLLLTLILTLSLCTPVLADPGDEGEENMPQQGQQENNGPQWPEGTEQCFSTKTIRKHITVVQVLVRGAG